MNKILVLAALLAFTGFVSAQCGSNASQVTVSGVATCYCNAGYYGTDASSASGNCAICTTGSNTSSTQGATNTGSGITLSACNICNAGYYVATAATGSSAAVCTKCPDYSTSTASSSLGSIASCTCYDANANTLSATQTTCTCKSGYSGSVATTSGGTGCTSSSSILSAVIAFALLLLLI